MAEPKRHNPKTVEPGHASGEPGGVAAVLRAARIRAGIDLKVAAETLRIRYVYLQAIEEGRFTDLPGPTYALGFVRAYAELLELDGKEIVRQFKDEGQGLSRRQALVFPEPLQEGRFPGGAVLLVAVVLAAGVYGGWYYWQYGETEGTGEVPQIPAKLAALVPAKPQAEPTPPTPSEALASNTGARSVAGTQPTAPGPAVSVAPAPPPAAPAKEIAPAGGSTSTAPLAAASPSNAPAASATPAGPAPSATGEAKPSPAAPSAANTMGAPTSSAAKPAESAMSGEPSKPAAAQAGADSNAAGTAAPASSAIPAAPDQLAALKPSEPRVYGENNADSRVLLTAKRDSWVQVRDKDSNVIWTRILRPGDSYKVPSQPGLTLLTGNAGALEVTVDGKTAPSLGAPGAVRRNIALDPEKLAAGTAGGQ